MIDNNCKSSSGSFSEHLSSIATNKNNEVNNNHQNQQHEQFTLNGSCYLTNINNQNPPTATLLELHKGRPIKLTIKVIVPVKDHPNFNFIGKLLGPKGNSLKWLQEETQTKMAILGRGSMRDKKKEEELTNSGDPKYFHLREDLHVEISTFAAPTEAYTRMGHALHQVQRFLVPDYYDDIRQQQLRELGVLNVSRGGPKGDNEIDSVINTSHHQHQIHHHANDSMTDDYKIFDESNGLTTKSNGHCSNTQNQPTPTPQPQPQLQSSTLPSLVTGSSKNLNLDNHSHPYNHYHPYHHHHHHHISCSGTNQRHYHNPTHRQHLPFSSHQQNPTPSLIHPLLHHVGYQQKCSHCPITKTIIQSTSPTLSSSSTSSSITTHITGGGGSEMTKTKSISSSSTETSPVTNYDCDLITKDCSCPHVELENSGNSQYI